MVRPVTLLVLFVAACATTPDAVPHQGSIHPQFSERRAAMIAVRIEAPPAIAAELDEAVRRELIERNYSPLAPGAAADPETGTLLVVATSERAEAAFNAPSGTLLYRMDTSADMDDPAAVAKVLLWSLPPK